MRALEHTVPAIALNKIGYNKYLYACYITERNLTKYILGAIHFDNFSTALLGSFPRSFDIGEKLFGVYVAVHAPYKNTPRWKIHFTWK